MVNYSQNNGDTIEDAIIVGAENEDEGVKAEYEYISQKYGEQEKKWKSESQALLKDNKTGKRYDKIKFKLLETGEEKEIYFDISSFFGKE